MKYREKRSCYSERSEKDRKRSLSLSKRMRKLSIKLNTKLVITFARRNLPIDFISPSSLVTPTIAGMSLNRRCFIAVSGCTVTMASSDSSSIVGAKMQQWPLHRTILFAKVSTKKILTKWNFRESSTKHSISRILYTIVDHGWKFRFVRSLSKTRLWTNFVLLVLRLVFIRKMSRNIEEPLRRWIAHAKTTKPSCLPCVPCVLFANR